MLAHERGRRLAAALVALSLYTTAHGSADRLAACAQESAARPRVGLALGGGSARGLAHVGVLEWLEERRIPVDAIAGTSIGALVGAAYASGRTATEVVTLVGGIDWDRLFSGEVDYALKSFRRKEDRRRYPVRLELGLRDGLRLAPGLDQGHAVDLFLSRLALPYSLPLSFDDLPIPFRAVATDLEAAAVVEIGSGSLASALRATMAFPGVFQPVEREGLLLADGGLLNNAPADVVSRMEVDVVIAVNVSAPLVTRDRLQSLVGVANQAIGVMMAERTRSVLARYADHVITPAVENVPGGAWRQFDTTRTLGYRAAAAAGDMLDYLALTPADWTSHLEARRTRRASTAGEPTFVRVEGVGPEAADAIGQVVEPLLRTALDPDALDLRLAELVGRGRFGSLGYDLLRNGGAGTGIGVRASGKPHGPPFVNVAIEVENRADEVELAAGTRLTVLDVGARDAEIRVDLVLGSDPDARVEYFLPRGGSPWFVAPRLELRNARQRFSVAGTPVASYRTRRVVAGADVGLTLGSRNELRIGYEAARFEARLRVGDPMLQYSGPERGVRVRWVYDGHDHWIAPRSGTRIETEARWLTTAPERQSGFLQAQFASATFFPAGREGRLFVALAGSAASADRLPPFHQSTLGGPFRLGAFTPDQFRGTRTAYAGSGYLHRLGQLPDLVGGPIHAGVWLESGSAFDAVRDAEIHSSVSAGLLLDTLLGALLASASVGTDGSTAFYVALGRPFW
ncbi:MAG: patatin-like phospholipase family protein [Acidobacteria bacterium]|nr:patatin-like phospholipase family protein [Acidobacteriota bacterium]